MYLIFLFCNDNILSVSMILTSNSTETALFIQKWNNPKITSYQLIGLYLMIELFHSALQGMFFAFFIVFIENAAFYSILL